MSSVTWFFINRPIEPDAIVDMDAMQVVTEDPQELDVSDLMEKRFSPASLVHFHLLEFHAAIESGIVGDPKAAHDNLLIQGGNLEALKVLLLYYAGRVKCIYIDPPYNTKSLFGQYDDNLEHFKWLSRRYPRLQLLYQLLNDWGVIFVSIDDLDYEYLKCMLDEIWGHSNYLVQSFGRRKKPSFLSKFGVITENTHQ